MPANNGSDRADDPQDPETAAEGEVEPEHETPAAVEAEAETTTPEEVELGKPTLTERVADTLAAAIESVESMGEEESAFDQFAYRRLSPWFRARQDRFAGYRKSVNQARVEETWDRYLARAALWSIIVSGFGALLGLTLALALTYYGVFAAIELGVSFPVSAQPLVTAAKTVATPLLILLFTLIGGVLFGGPVVALLYYAPKMDAYNRAREIEFLLPQAVTYMYALSQGNTTFPAIVKELAQDESTYGEVAVAFQAVQNNMDYFGADLRAALRDAREATPSDELAELFDDMVSIIDSGGRLSPFLKDKTDEYQERARRKKEDFLDTLEFLGEMYVTVAIVGILLAIVVFVVMASIAGAGMLRIKLIVYVGIPLISLLFIIVVDSMSADDMGTTATLPTESREVSPEAIEERLTYDTHLKRGELPETERATTDGGTSVTDPTSRTSGHSGPLSPIERASLRQFHAALRRRRVLRTLRAPIEVIRDQPLWSLVITVPVALVLIVLFAVTGISVPTMSNFVNLPVWTTTFSLVIPSFVVMIPFSYFHEKNRRHKNRVNRELPDMLKKLASANETGMTLAESIELVANSSEGYLANELSKANNELKNANVSLEEALVRFANRVENPRLTRVVKLLIEANTSSGRVRDVLDVTAKDTEAAHRIERDRLKEMMLHMAITVFGNLVFLGISWVLITQLLPPLAEAAQAGTGRMAGRGLFGGGFNVSVFKMLFFHAALLQSCFSGFVAGKLGFDDTYAGTKFAVVQMTLAVIVFFIA